LLAGLLLALPALLLNGNLHAVQAANAPETERTAREVLAQPLPWRALLIGDWSVTEGLHYLQDVEGLRPDLECGTILDRQLIVDTLGGGRAVYLLKPAPELGLAQWPEGPLWRVGLDPLAGTAPIDRRWEEGIRLAGYLLPPGPYQPGQVVPITLAWEATATPRAAYRLFVHLIGPDGTIHGQQDRTPITAPTDQWHAGGRAVDLYSPALDPAAPPGRYRVTLGWYTATPERRLRLADVPAGTEPADYITLGEIEVAPAQ
jgi:hypothetical protein